MKTLAYAFAEQGLISLEKRDEIEKAHYRQKSANSFDNFLLGSFLLVMLHSGVAKVVDGKLVI